MPAWITSALSLFSSACSFVLKYFTAKNEPDVRRAVVAQDADKVDQENTKAVRDAIRTGDISNLSK